MSEPASSAVGWLVDTVGAREWSGSGYRRYAEEFPVSRYFLDARVLSIFERADETLALEVITRRLAEQAGAVS